MVNKTERFSIERSASILQKRLAEESDPIKKAKLQKRIAKHESNDRIYQKVVSELRVAPNDETLKAEVVVCESILFPKKRKRKPENSTSQSIWTVSGGLPSLGKKV